MPWLFTRDYGINRMPLNRLYPKFPRIIHKSKKWSFSGRVFCAGSEFMLDVTNGHILAEKSSKNPLFGKIFKSGKKNRPKIYFLFFNHAKVLKHAEHSGEGHFHF
jgi:hypothetical protein